MKATALAVRTYSEIMDTEHRLVAAKRERLGKIDWEFGVSRCKLLY